ncbi:MAG: alpha/beta fold hydrolase [Nevskiales bacterium]
MPSFLLWPLPLLGLLLASARCAAEPMPSSSYGEVTQAQEIVVLLPGIKDRGADFDDEGFVAAAKPLIQQRRLALIAADAHFGYYRARTVYQRLYEDVLKPLPPTPITLAGISLGGFGALGLARRHPERVRRLLLLAPFLGDDAFIERLRRDGLAARKNDEAFEQELLAAWRYLSTPRKLPQIELWYGAGDDFAPAYALLHQKNPQLTMHALDGGHDWHTWLALWKSWLARLSR